MWNKIKWYLQRIEITWKMVVLYIHAWNNKLNEFYFVSEGTKERGFNLSSHRHSSVIFDFYLQVSQVLPGYGYLPNTYNIDLQ